MKTATIATFPKRTPECDGRGCEAIVLQAGIFPVLAASAESNRPTGTAEVTVWFLTLRNAVAMFPDAPAG